MLRAFLVAVIALCPALAPAQPAGEQHPGYGVVESMTPLKRKPEPSASAGSSAKAPRQATTWLVRVRMDDGSVQVREMKKRRDISVGSRVLLTNAGDILPD